MPVIVEIIFCRRIPLPRLDIISGEAVELVILKENHELCLVEFTSYVISLQHNGIMGKPVWSSMLLNMYIQVAERTKNFFLICVSNPSNESILGLTFLWTWKKSFEYSSCTITFCKDHPREICFAFLTGWCLLLLKFFALVSKEKHMRYSFFFG